MRDHTVCLLKECDSGCKMALDSMAQIKGYVSDQKLKNTIDGYEKKHQAMEEEAYKQLKSLGEGGKEPEMMAAAFSRMSTGMKMLMKDDNRQAAKILMDGCSMGIQSICGFRNQYAGASRESMDAGCAIWCPVSSARTYSGLSAGRLFFVAHLENEKL